MAEHENIGSEIFKVLIVDDEENVRDMLVTYLESEGYDVITAENGMVALASIEEHDPQVVLLYIRMPNMDGLEATRAIRERGLSIPIVAMTAHAMKGDRERCLAAGMDEYISKPIKAADLQAVIERAMSASVGVVSTALF